MNMSGSYSPLAVASRRRIKSPTQWTAFVGRKRISSNARRLLSSITGSPKAKKNLTCEAEIPVIFYPDEDSLPYKGVKREDSFVDPFAFEAKVHDAEEKKKNSALSSPVSFEIKGTIRCVPTLATIIENEQQEKEEASSFQRGREKCDVIISPTSIKDDVDPSDCTHDLTPIRLFQDDVFDSNEITKSGCGDEENDVDEAISFLDEAFFCLAAGVSCCDEENESLEDWVDSASLRNGFTKAEGFQSHDWVDNTE